MQTKIFTGIAAGAIATIALASVATPAMATSFAGDNVEVGGTTWTVDLVPFGLSEVTTARFLDGLDDSYFQTWDDRDGSPESFDCVDAEINTGTGETPDVTISCASDVAEVGLTRRGEILLYSEGDLARMMFVLTNETGSPVDFSWQLFTDFGETTYRATSRIPEVGAVGYVDADVWVYNQSVPDALNVGVAWGLPGVDLGHEFVSEDSFDELYVWTNDEDGQFSLAPGESATLAYYYKIDEGNSVETVPVTAEEGVSSVPAALTPAQVMAEFDTFNGRLTRGLDPDLLVGNWGVASDDSADGNVDEPELAETGLADVALTIGWGAILVFLAGLGLAWRSRAAREVIEH